MTLLEDVYGVSRRTRYLGDVTVGGSTERDTSGERITGPDISVQLPLFNQGRGSVLRAQARLGQARADLAALQIEISNEVDLARKRVLFARKLSERYRDEFIPLRERIAQRTQEQVNFMLVGQFELIRVKQLEYETYQRYLESLRDYWVARAELSRQVGARLPSESNSSDSEAGPQLPTDPGEAVQDMPGMDSTGGGEGIGSMPGMKGKHEAGMRMQSMPEAKAGSKVHNGKSMPGMQPEGDKTGKASAPKATSKSLCDQIERADVNDPLMRALREKCLELARPRKGAMEKDKMKGMGQAPDDGGGR